MKFSKWFGLALLVLALLSSTGCYWKREVESNEVAIESYDGVSISNIVGEGRYTQYSWGMRFAEIHIMDASAKTVVWEDASVWTADTQNVGVSLSVTYRRPNHMDQERVRQLWNTYRTEARDDGALATLVLARIPEAVKAVTTQYSIYEMTGVAEAGQGSVEDAQARAQARQKTSREIESNIQEELDDIGLIVINVSVNNIEPSTAFAETVEQMALADAKLKLAQRETARLEEVLIQEQKQTTIDLEIASREQQVAAKKAETYEKSDRAYELERLRLLGEVVGPSDKLYFVPEGTDLTLFLGNQTGVPVR